jgi:hypothetical protein
MKDSLCFYFAEISFPFVSFVAGGMEKSPLQSCIQIRQKM